MNNEARNEMKINAAYGRAYDAGFRDCFNFVNHGVRRACSYSGLLEQAYDQGFQSAMKVIWKD